MEDKKYILKCPVALFKFSIDIRPPILEVTGNFAVVLNPSLRKFPPFSQAGIQITPPNNNHLPMNRPINLVVWNIHGANNEEFKRNFRDLINTHNPCMVALLETKMADHTSLYDEFHFSEMLQVPAIGHARGIAILWFDNLVTINQISNSHQEIHVMLQVTPNHTPFLISIVYAST